IEREADYFASCLLMPEERFSKDISGKKFSYELIDSLRTTFCVSITACAFRFAEIGNHPIMMVYSENGRVIWKNCSEDFPYKYLLYEDRVPPNSVMGEYFQNIGSNLYKQEEVWAVDIFQHVRNDSVYRKFFEYCIMHKGKALSIIWED